MPAKSFYITTGILVGRSKPPRSLLSLLMFKKGAYTERKIYNEAIVCKKNQNFTVCNVENRISFPPINPVLTPLFKNRHLQFISEYKKMLSAQYRLKSTNNFDHCRLLVSCV